MPFVTLHSSPMRTRRIIGIVLVATGGVWIAQGSGALHGSFMTGEGMWTVIGVIAVLFGFALLVGVARDRRRGARDDDPGEQFGGRGRDSRPALSQGEGGTARRPKG